LSLRFRSEAALCAAAAQAARAWRGAGIAELSVGLKGDLGAGKTTFVRAMLEALGYSGRVPSPTYTLLEQYALGELCFVHLDLYRLKDPRELEYLGLRDWLALPRVWVLAEWPEKGGAFAATLDLTLEFDIGADDSRGLTPRAITERGRRALAAWLDPDIK
jgi:tRNA threonylcarbamoyladenosine biosynthesis protein TsaE